MHLIYFLPNVGRGGRVPRCSAWAESAPPPGDTPPHGAVPGAHSRNDLLLSCQRAPWERCWTPFPALPHTHDKGDHAAPRWGRPLAREGDSLTPTGPLLTPVLHPQPLSPGGSPRWSSGVHTSPLRGVGVAERALAQLSPHDPGGRVNPTSRPPALLKVLSRPPERLRKEEAETRGVHTFARGHTAARWLGRDMKAGACDPAAGPFPIRDGPVSLRGPQMERPDRAGGAGPGQALELGAAPYPHPSLPLIQEILLI